MSYFYHPATWFISGIVFSLQLFSSLPHVWSVVPGFYSFVLDRHDIPCLHKDVAFTSHLTITMLKQLPVAIRHVCLLRLRLSTTDATLVYQQMTLASIFSPIRGVWTSTSSIASGAFYHCSINTLPLPSTLQFIDPAKPARHNRRKKPSLNH